MLEKKIAFVFTLRDIIHEFFLWLTCNHFGRICRHYRKENTKAFEVCPENGFKKSFLAILVVVDYRKLVAIPRATALFQLRFVSKKLFSHENQEQPKLLLTY